MKIDTTGQTFGKLFVLGLAGFIGNDRAVAIACECGMIRRMAQTKLTKKIKAARSCGCVMGKGGWIQSTHEMTNHKFYPIWRAIRGRCYNEKNISYTNYGARGIKICEEWRDSPIKFIGWLENHNYKKGLEIDRIDNDSDYSPENCRVATRSQNQRNKRTSRYVIFNGVKRLLIELAEEYGIKYATLYNRIFIYKMSVEEAILFKFNSRRSRG